jgi:hypothetical protein
LGRPEAHLDLNILVVGPLFWRYEWRKLLAVRRVQKWPADPAEAGLLFEVGRCR